MRCEPDFFKSLTSPKPHWSGQVFNGRNPMSNLPIWRPLATTDLEGVHRIGGIVHAQLPERPAILAEKLQLFPEGCFKLASGEAIVGYALSHAWALFSVPPLNEPLLALPARPDCIHLHDIALLPEARGRGCVAVFMAALPALAACMKLKNLACVSVYGTDALWARYGFQIDDSADFASNLASYGATAKYMIARV